MAVGIHVVQRFCASVPVIYCERAVDFTFVFGNMNCNSTIVFDGFGVSSRWEIEVNGTSGTFILPDIAGSVIELNAVEQQAIAYMLIQFAISRYILPEGSSTIATEETFGRTFCAVVVLQFPVGAICADSEDVTYIDIKWEGDIIHAELVCGGVPCIHCANHIIVFKLHYANQFLRIDNFFTRLKPNLRNTISRLTVADNHDICVQINGSVDLSTISHPSIGHNIGFEIICDTILVHGFSTSANQSGSRNKLRLFVIVFCCYFGFRPRTSLHIQLVHPVTIIGKEKFVLVQAGNFTITSGQSNTVLIVNLAGCITRITSFFYHNQESRRSISSTAQVCAGEGVGLAVPRETHVGWGRHFFCAI